MEGYRKNNRLLLFLMPGIISLLSPNSGPTLMLVTVIKLSVFKLCNRAVKFHTVNLFDHKIFTFISQIYSNVLTMKIIHKHPSEILKALFQIIATSAHCNKANHTNFGSPVHTEIVFILYCGLLCAIVLCLKNNACSLI